MTTIIRSDVKLSAPKTGALILPSLGISGIKHRWHAESAVLANNALTVQDSVGNIPLTTTAGAVTVKEVANGRRYLDFSAGAVDNVIASNTMVKEYSAFTLAMLYYWDALPSGAMPILTTQTNMTNPTAMNLVANGYGVSTWNTGEGSKAVVSPGSLTTPPGWHTLIVGYDKVGNELASLDGNSFRDQGHGVPQANVTMFAIRGRAAIRSRMVEASYIDHVLTDVEIQTMHKALISQIP